MFSLKTIAIVLFVLMYILMIAKQDYRPYFAIGTAIIFAILGILPIKQVYQAIDGNVLMMIAGTAIIVDFFIDSKMPNRIADFLLQHSKNAMWVVIYMSLFAGIVSAFIDNVATVLMIAPVGLAVCKQLGISPVNTILAIAVSSNLQGAATLVGDTTSIMLAGYAGMDFLDFFFMHGKPGIFFAVELGALLTIPVMMYLFRKEKDPIDKMPKTEVKAIYPTIMLLGVVITLISASFIPNKPSITNGLICCTYALITLIIDYIKNKDSKRINHALASLDFETLFLLAGLFCVIAGIKQVGVIDDVANLIASVGGNNLFLLYTIVVWGSVIFSAFIDNIPYVATMLPILMSVSNVLGIEPYLLYFGLLSGATLGGNITPIGSSTHIAAVGILKKEGYEVSFPEFMKVGIPFTLVAVIASYIYLWLIWA